MISVIIKPSGEDSVDNYTVEHVKEELRGIYGAETLVGDWFTTETKKNNSFICFVESEGVFSDGYFLQISEFLNSNKMYRKMAMISPVTSVIRWNNKLYGYHLNNDTISPTYAPKSTSQHQIQMGFVPGSVIRKSTFNKIKDSILLQTEDLFLLSIDVSLAFWDHGDGNSVHLLPNIGYATMDDTIESPFVYVGIPDRIKEKFKKEFI